MYYKLTKCDGIKNETWQTLREIFAKLIKKVDLNMRLFFMKKFQI